MAGHRDDGTFADDKAHHPGRKVGRPQWQTDQHAIAHADGFVGPRVGEAYQSHNSKTGTAMAPLSKGGVQTTPASDYVVESGQAGPGTAGRQAHLDRMMHHTSPRMLQHKGTGNIIEASTSFDGSTRVNEYGTAANGMAMKPHKDKNMASSGTPIDPSSDDYTDVTEAVRQTSTYKSGSHNKR